MIAILWSYEVRPEASRAFERAYGPEGDWALLFRRSGAYLGTELLRGPGESWLTIDRWRSRAGRDAFMAANREEYEALDRACGLLTTEERALGIWNSLPAPKK